MIIKSIQFAYFKGFADTTIKLNAKLTEICGKNGVGKTSVGIGSSWVFSGKDLELQDEPEVRNLSNPECDSRVDVVCDIDSKEVTFSKFQVDTRTKKQKEEDAPLRISNRYEINGVPKTAKDFFKTIEGYGIDVENWLLLTNPEYFMSLKKTERRDVVFPLAGSVTDMEVAKTIEECADLVKRLEDNTVEEIVAQEKAKAKRSAERQKAIPSEIAGMEKSKVEVDPTLPKLIADLQSEIAEETQKRDDAKAKADAKAIDGRIKELRNRKTAIYNDANSERLEKLRKAHEEVDKADDAVVDVKRNLYRIQTSGDSINANFKTVSDLAKRLTAELKDVKAQKFTGRTVCPTCGQKIPKNQVDDAKAKFAEQQKSRIDEIEKKIADVKKQLDGLKADGKGLADAKKDAEKAVEDAKKVLAEKQAVLSQYTTPVDPDYSDIDAEIASLNDEKQKCDDYAKLAYSIHDAIVKKNELLQSYIRRKAMEDHNQRIDEQIEESREALKVYGQQKADAEKMLYQIQLLSQRKNEMLSDAVNSHFTRVKFRLFSTQKNGEIKDDCTPLVLCSDGEYRDMTYSANTAAIVMAKLDICSGLQKFYGQNLPIWLDGAECLDEENRKALAMDSQLILLCVTEDSKLEVR